MVKKFCRLCNRNIDAWKRKDSIFCGDYCRKKAYDIRTGRCKQEMAIKSVEGVGN